MFFLGGLVTAATAGMSDAEAPTSATDVAVEQIPASMLDVYASAADACPGLPWQLLAAVAGTADAELASQLDPTSGEVHPAHLGPLLNGQGGEAKIPTPPSPGAGPAPKGRFRFSARSGHLGTAAPDTGRTVPDPQNAWDSSFTLAHVLCTYLGHENGDPEAALADYDPSPLVGPERRRPCSLLRHGCRPE